MDQLADPLWTTAAGSRGGAQLDHDCPVAIPLLQDMISRMVSDALTMPGSWTLGRQRAATLTLLSCCIAVATAAQEPLTPSGLRVDFVTRASVSLAWIQSAGAQQYKAEYRAVGSVSSFMHAPRLPADHSRKGAFLAQC